MQDPKSQCNKYAQIIIDAKTFSLPLRESTAGPNVIDVTDLYKLSGYFTYDNGFISTASCRSKITYIDGDKGVLKHCGYDIHDLVDKSNFLEVSYLLLYGKLPTKIEYENFVENVTRHSMIDEQMSNVLHGFTRDTHPMAIMLSCVGSLSGLYYNEIDVRNSEHRDDVAIKIIAKMPTIAAMIHKYSVGQPVIYPDNNLNFTENFLRMMFATPCEKYKVNKILSQALDKIFILHADHEQNASTSTVRLAGSSTANPFACVSAGIASLWGVSHGGANQKVIEMLEQIKTPDRIQLYIDKAKDKNDPFKLMGFGHRVYKNYDPRAETLKATCKEVLSYLGKLDNNPLLQIATQLEHIVLHDEYFIIRKLYPNVDFYSGIIYQAMGIPVQMFTVLFAVARSVGWIAQWREMYQDEDFRIGRPRQLYIGKTNEKFKPLHLRT
ncbi:MAG: citrate synthase [Rickettsiaceae bacterium]